MNLKLQLQQLRTILKFPGTITNNALSNTQLSLDKSLKTMQQNEIQLICIESQTWAQKI